LAILKLTKRIATYFYVDIIFDIRQRYNLIYHCLRSGSYLQFLCYYLSPDNYFQCVLLFEIWQLFTIPVLAPDYILIPGYYSQYLCCISRPASV